VDWGLFDDHHTTLLPYYPPTPPPYADSGLGTEVG
jgi:hypothetical protein